MSFTERNIPPRTPAGPNIPEGVRVSLLSWMAQHMGVNTTSLWQTLCQREGYGRFAEIEDDMRERFSQQDADAFMGAMAQHWERDRHRVTAVSGVDYNAEPALKAIPAPLFLDGLEYALAANSYARVEAINEINRLFAKRGVYYRFSFTGQAEWHGDPGTYGSVLRPALDVLADVRLVGCRSEFQAAMDHLRAGTAKDREDAVEEAGKSVESAMKVLLHENGIGLSGKETARPLFDKLAQKNICAAEADNAVLGAMRLRNAYGGHGAGTQARQIPDGVPELSVHAAATAITYLASLLP